MFSHPTRGVCLQLLNGLCNAHIGLESKEEMRVIRRTPNGDRNDTEVLGDATQICPQFGPEIIRDCITPIFGREDAMKVGGGVGMRHEVIFEDCAELAYRKPSEYPRFVQLGNGCA